MSNGQMHLGSQDLPGLQDSQGSRALMWWGNRGIQESWVQREKRVTQVHRVTQETGGTPEPQDYQENPGGMAYMD